MKRGIVDFLIGSITDPKTKKASGRKLTAFWVMVIYTILHVWWLSYAYKHEDFLLLPQILTIDAGLILTLLGLTTWEKVKSPSEPTQ